MDDPVRTRPDKAAGAPAGVGFGQKHIELQCGTSASAGVESGDPM